jgi:hypothetical protein
MLTQISDALQRHSAVQYSQRTTFRGASWGRVGIEVVGEWAARDSNPEPAD